MSGKRSLATIICWCLLCFVVPSSGESPKRRSCLSTFDMISPISFPLSVTAIIVAFLWSIHKPTTISTVFPQSIRSIDRLPHLCYPIPPCT